MAPHPAHRGAGLPQPDPPALPQTRGERVRDVCSGGLYQSPRRCGHDPGLRRVVRGESFDEQPMPDLDSEALDFRAASESFASVRRLARHDLVTLHLVTNHQGRRVPTVGGMILFGLERAVHFPDAWIQAGRFAGVDKTHIADHAELREPPGRAIERRSSSSRSTPSMGDDWPGPARSAGTSPRWPCGKRL